MSMGVPAAAGILALGLVVGATGAVTTASDAYRDTVTAQVESAQRLREAANERIELASSELINCSGPGGQDRCDLETFWNNSGSHAIDTGDVAVLVCGDWTAPSSDRISHFEVHDGGVDSDLWLPGEELHVIVAQSGNDENDVHVTVAGPLGGQGHRFPDGGGNGDC